jgi:hypothetical protein
MTLTESFRALSVPPLRLVQSSDLSPLGLSLTGWAVETQSGLLVFGGSLGPLFKVCYFVLVLYDAESVLWYMIIPDIDDYPSKSIVYGYGILTD